MAKTIKLIASSPILYIFLFALAGMACIVFGVYTVWGAGAAFITSGAFLILIAAFIATGLKQDG